MTVRSFFDTNVLVYTDDADASEKCARSLTLWEEHRRSGHAVVSVQVLQEYFVATTRKLGVDPGIAIEKMMLFARADVVNPSAVDTIAAARLSVEHRLSFWDAMIVHMADQAGCAALFSEDLQAGRRILGLEIVDPFTFTE